LSSNDPKVRILFVGDMHLGVLPSHVPEHLAVSHQIRARELGPAEAWKRVVDIAIEKQVHAVALAGDLVESTNALFEAIGPLESGVRRLDQANIPVVAVAGNHDTEALPRLAGMIDSLHLLGPQGTWSSHVINGDAGLEVRLTGWSFPRPHSETSPLSDNPPAADPNRATLGLLHADLDQASSQYAPVSSKELMATGYRAWFLGHIHLPGQPSSDGRPFYLGSVTGLHPGETGEHGPVLATLDSREKMTLQRLPLAPLRWEKLEIPCENKILSKDDLLVLLLNRIDNRAREIGEALDRVTALGFRLTLTGDLDDPASLRKALGEVQNHPSGLVTDRRGTVLFIDQINNETTLRLDLLDVARSESPEGLLARRILVLEGTETTIPGVADPHSLKETLVSRSREALKEVDGQSPYLAFADDYDALEIARVLARTGRRALEEILSRKEADHEAG
jgi:DNA repair protein SbcD/Mre11